MRQVILRILGLALSVSCGPASVPARSASDDAGQSAAARDSAIRVQDTGITALGKCTSDCSQLLWPRLIVDVSSGEESSITIEIVGPDGTHACGTPHCPSEAADVGLHCSCSVSTGESDVSVTLSLTAQGGGSTRLEVPLGEFNHCGRDIAYVVASVSPQGGVDTQAVRYVNPCSAL
ncbi:MAG: hypothetical protein RL385_4596 [Pseudomonadota bacterium]|jgi:hypothetical protein